MSLTCLRRTLRWEWPPAAGGAGSRCQQPGQAEQGGSLTGAGGGGGRMRTCWWTSNHEGFKMVGCLSRHVTLTLQDSCFSNRGFTKDQAPMFWGSSWLQTNSVRALEAQYESIKLGSWGQTHKLLVWSFYTRGVGGESRKKKKGSKPVGGLLSF